MPIKNSLCSQNELPLKKSSEKLNAKVAERILKLINFKLICLFCD